VAFTITGLHCGNNIVKFNMLFPFIGIVVYAISCKMCGILWRSILKITHFFRINLR
jgi:hypothetical protein